MHTYPGLFGNAAFRPRIHRNGHTYPHVSGAFWKRSDPKTELFVNAPESGSFENGGFGSGSFFACEHGIRDPDLFCHCFQGDQKWHAQAMNIASRAFAVSLPKSVAAHFFFVSKGVAFENKTEDGCCCLQKQLYLVAFLDEGGVFYFCFILLRLLFVLHFAFGAFLVSPASIIRKLRTLLPRGTSTWSNTEERHWLAKETNKKSAIWARGESVHRGRDFQVEARFLGSIHVRVNGVSGLTYDTCGHPKTDLFENGSFWKRIRVHIA